MALLALIIHAIAAVAAVVSHRCHRRTAVRRVSCLKRKQCNQKGREIQKEALCHLGDHSAEFASIKRIVTHRHEARWIANGFGQCERPIKAIAPPFLNLAERPFLQAVTLYFFEVLNANNACALID